MTAQHYSVPHVAETLDVAERTVREWIAGGDLRAVNVGGEGHQARYRISAADLDRFLASRATAAA